MIEKVSEVETLEISGDRVIIRERIAIMEDGKEIAHTFAHRELGLEDEKSVEAVKIKDSVRKLLLAEKPVIDAKG